MHGLGKVKLYQRFKELAILNQPSIDKNQIFDRRICDKKQQNKWVVGMETVEVAVVVASVSVSEAEEGLLQVQST